jgi:hypothetical protein
MPCPRTGILAALAIAVVVGGTAFAPRGGAGDTPGRGVVRMHADAICGRAIRVTSRLPRSENRRESIALARELARLLRWSASELRAAGSGDLAWAHQRWAAAVDDVRQALRREEGSARAGATELVARQEAAAAAQELGARDCVRLARSA